MSHRGRWMILWAIPLVLSSGSLYAQEERWVYRYNGPGNYWDEARSIVMGADGNLYAAGRSHQDGTSQDFTVISLTPLGVERWIYLYNGPADSLDAAYSIVTGTDGNLYVAGWSTGTETDADLTVVSLTPAGGERWVYRYNGPGNDWDEARSIVMGQDGNLYAAGHSGGSGTQMDFTVVSLDTSGGERWVYRYNGPGIYYDRAHSIATGTDSNLYAAGETAGSGSLMDFTVVSLTPSGGERWVYVYNGVWSDEDGAYSIAVAADSNLYVGGYETEWESIPYPMLVVISLTPSGDQRWVCHTGRGWACSVVTGGDGNIYAAGSSQVEEPWWHFTVTSMTPSGGWIWDYRLNASDEGVAYSIVAGKDGNVYAAGENVGSGTGNDFTVVSLTPAGGERWVYRYDGPASSSDRAYSIIMGPDSSLYAAGYSRGSRTHNDFTVISLTPDVGVEENSEARDKMPKARLELSVFPVPAPRGVNVQYSLSRATEVKLTICDGSGRLVQELLNAEQEAGSKTVVWDCRDSTGKRVPSGTYFVRLQTPNFWTSRKLIIF